MKTVKIGKKPLLNPMNFRIPDLKNASSWAENVKNSGFQKKIIIHGRRMFQNRFLSKKFRFQKSSFEIVFHSVKIKNKSDFLFIFYHPPPQVQSGRHQFLLPTSYDILKKFASIGDTLVT